jgi:Arc/MetJ-type ribon-helix-helix transcriptional regulator
MDVTLSKASEALVERLLEAGGYRNVEELLGDALELLAQESADLSDLEDSVIEAFAEIDRGGGTVLTPKLADEILLELRLPRSRPQSA